MMSASPGNVQDEAASHTAETNRGDSGPCCDLERGDHDADERRYNPAEDGGADEDPNKETDEYARLLKFIDVEAKKMKRRGEEGEEEDQQKEYRRVWYMPWKKEEGSWSFLLSLFPCCVLTLRLWLHTVSGSGVRKTPKAWLETDMGRGLTDAEVAPRREKFGYNELER